MDYGLTEYAVTLTGQHPALMHADNVEAADDLKKWQKDPANKDVSIPGDDRSPPWTWQSYLYHDGTHIACPQENIMAMLAKAGAMVPMKKGRASFKATTQSALCIPSEYWEFRSHGKQLPIAAIMALAPLPFAEQVKAAKKLGFELLVKRARVDKKKHVRVRPMFRNWGVSGIVQVMDPIVDLDILTQLFSLGGIKIGLFDWRPGSPTTPGPYGTCKAEIKPVGAKKSA